MASKSNPPEIDFPFNPSSSSARDLVGLDGTSLIAETIVDIFECFVCGFCPQFDSELTRILGNVDYLNFTWIKFFSFSVFGLKVTRQEDLSGLLVSAGIILV